MLHPSTCKLIDKLSEMTHQRKVAWTEDARGSVTYDTEGYKVVISGDPHGVLLTTVEGKVLEEATPEDIADTPATNGGATYKSIVEALYREATRQAKGTEDAIDSVLKGLGIEEKKFAVTAPSVEDDPKANAADKREAPVEETETAKVAVQQTPQSGPQPTPAVPAERPVSGPGPGQAAGLGGSSLGGVGVARQPVGATPPQGQARPNAAPGTPAQPTPQNPAVTSRPAGLQPGQLGGQPSGQSRPAATPMTTPPPAQTAGVASSTSGRAPQPSPPPAQPRASSSGPSQPADQTPSTARPGGLSGQPGLANPTQSPNSAPSTQRPPSQFGQPVGRTDTSTPPRTGGPATPSPQAPSVPPTRPAGAIPVASTDASASASMSPQGQQPPGQPTVGSVGGTTPGLGVPQPVQPPAKPTAPPPLPRQAPAAPPHSSAPPPTPPAAAETQDAPKPSPPPQSATRPKAGVAGGFGVGALGRSIRDRMTGNTQSGASADSAPRSTTQPTQPPMATPPVQQPAPVTSTTAAPTVSAAQPQQPTSPTGGQQQPPVPPKPAGGPGVQAVPPAAATPSAMSPASAPAPSPETSKPAEPSAAEPDAEEDETIVPKPKPITRFNPWN